MKKKKFFCNLLTLFVVSLLGMFVTSCHDDVVSVNMTSVNFDADGGSQTITVTSNTNWSVSGCPSWLTVNPPQGNKNGSFTITATANSNESPKDCVLYVNAGDAYAVIQVSQKKQDKGNDIDVMGTTWKVNHSFEGGYNTGTTLIFSSSTARLNLIEKQGNQTLTTEYTFTYRQSGNLVILTPQQENIATLEGLIENKIKMTIKNTSNNAEVCVMYKE